MSEPETNIGLLMTRDPLKWSEGDFVAVIKKLRESRHLFNSGVKAPTGKALTAKEKEVSNELAGKDLGISLDDI